MMRVMRRWLWLKRLSQRLEARGKLGPGEMAVMVGGGVVVFGWGFPVCERTGAKP